MQPTSKGPLSPLSPRIQARGGQAHSSPPDDTSSGGRDLKLASGRFGTSTHCTLVLAQTAICTCRALLALACASYPLSLHRNPCGPDPPHFTNQEVTFAPPHTSSRCSEAVRATLHPFPSGDPVSMKVLTIQSVSG